MSSSRESHFKTEKFVPDHSMSGEIDSAGFLKQDGALASLLSTLSCPEDTLASALLGNAHAGPSAALTVSLIGATSRFFDELERLATIRARQCRNRDGEEDLDDTTMPLSSLPELHTGLPRCTNHVDPTNVLSAVDSETLWGQVDLQNRVLLDGTAEGNVNALKKSIKKLSKMTGGLKLLDIANSEKGDHDFEFTKENDDEENEESGDQKLDEDGEIEDEKALRIRQRMERVMADDMDDESDAEFLGGTSNDFKGPGEEGKRDEKREEESYYDPIAEDMKDGFFDLNEMEAFADEEEEYLPNKAYEYDQDDEEERDGETKSKRKGKDKKSIQQRNREGGLLDSESDSDSQGGGDDRLSRRTKAVRRRKYRSDEDIEALYKLYENPSENEGHESDDDHEDPASITAADFFGKPDKQLIERYKRKHPKRGKGARDDLVAHNSSVGDSDLESWNDHNFEGENDDDWRVQNSASNYEDAGADRNIVVKTDGEGNDEIEEEDEPEDGESDGNELKAVQSTALTSTRGEKETKLLQLTLALEKEILAEKPWQMSGETTATSRPVDSLLETTPEFSQVSKAPPLLTAEHTASIEELIKRRILAEEWDDLVPREIPDIGKKSRDGELPEVSQEKSRLGLGELYEREYLKKATGYDVDANEKESEAEKVKSEMRALFANLCSKLDALSNYHFAPRPVADEAEVKKATVPAIAMEETIPLHVSGARAAAPEEVYSAKSGREGVLRGQSEVGQAERKRLRNAKKSARRKARKAKLADEKLLSRLEPGLGLNNPYEKRKVREELQTARARGKVVSGEMDANTDFKTSGTFFKRLQEQAELEVRGGGEGRVRKKKRAEGPNHNFKAFML